MKRITYFLTASLTVFSQATTCPANGWEWAKLIAACVVGGGIALRAVESKPESETKPPADFQAADKARQKQDAVKAPL